jgi:hypothetical protein
LNGDVNYFVLSKHRFSDWYKRLHPDATITKIAQRGILAAIASASDGCEATAPKQFSCQVDHLSLPFQICGNSISAKLRYIVEKGTASMGVNLMH